jgi:hypothetical protein
MNVSIIRTRESRSKWRRCGTKVTAWIMPRYWIGNTAVVAAKHYMQITDAGFDGASEGGAQSGALGGKTMAQNQSQMMSANSGQTPQETHKAPEN